MWPTWKFIYTNYSHGYHYLLLTYHRFHSALSIPNNLSTVKKKSTSNLASKSSAHIVVSYFRNPKDLCQTIFLALVTFPSLAFRKRVRVSWGYPWWTFCILNGTIRILYKLKKNIIFFCKKCDFARTPLY